MSTRVNLDGRVGEASEMSVSLANRAFKYGDSLFETLRVFDGKIPFLDLHFERLLKGMRVLRYDNPAHFDIYFVETEIRKLIGGTGNHRVRFMVFRDPGGLYTPASDGLHFLIETSPLDSPRFEFSSKGLKVGLLEEQLLHKTPLSGIKTGSSLPYVYAAREAKANGWDEVFIKGEMGMVVDGMSSNILVVNGSMIYTNFKNYGGIDGVMRKVLKEKLGYNFIHLGLAPAILENAEGILFTNSIKGIQWVSEFGQYEYDPPAVGFEMVTKLNRFLKS